MLTFEALLSQHIFRLHILWCLFSSNSTGSAHQIINLESG